mmetsp:Transcript_21258/g.59408  ORF Transcript_21258/g.59408 Transcript_21258/m.59408 type:complete len:205 (+) Transcript_21258:774-1388(+)
MGCSPLLKRRGESSPLAPRPNSGPLPLGTSLPKPPGPPKGLTPRPRWGIDCCASSPAPPPSSAADATKERGAEGEGDSVRWCPWRHGRLGEKLRCGGETDLANSTFNSPLCERCRSSAPPELEEARYMEPPYGPGDDARGGSTATDTEEGAEGLACPCGGGGCRTKDPNDGDIALPRGEEGAPGDAGLSWWMLTTDIALFGPAK